MINTHLFDLQRCYDIVCIGGPFFDVDIASGNPVCVAVAGNARVASTVRRELFARNREELSSYYNCDTVGVEACGALKNIVANIKGIADCCGLGSSFPGTIFARAGVEMRAISKISRRPLPHLSRPGGRGGQCYVTLSSNASKNYRYGGGISTDCYTGNTIGDPTRRVSCAGIDGTPEGPGTLKERVPLPGGQEHVQPHLPMRLQDLQRAGTREEIREQIIMPASSTAGATSTSACSRAWSTTCSRTSGTGVRRGGWAE
jgi:glycerol-3-phosphate dehydrogenase (NAD(P)+)